jgi:hypothetical protein
MKRRNQERGVRKKQFTVDSPRSTEKKQATGCAFRIADVNKT